MAGNVPEAYSCVKWILCIYIMHFYYVREDSETTGTRRRPDMDLSLLRSLVTVADAGAITEAAGRLGITQPALTRRIQQLEQEFGAELLSRSRKGAELTELGRLVEREARLLIDRYDALKQEVASHSNVEGGTVRIGGGATAVSFLLPDAIASYQRAHPRVHFHVKEASSSEIASDVADGHLELGLVTQLSTR